MATTATPRAHTHQRTSSHSRTRVPSRPTTPLRPPSRTSLRASQSTPSGLDASLSAADFPLASLEPAFAELSDSMADLEANFMHLQLLNESLGRFNENFGAFLYGMNMSAFCVDFPEAPIPHSFARHQSPSINTGSSQPVDSPFRTDHQRNAFTSSRGAREDVDATFMTNDTSFVENPPTSIRKPASKYTPAPPPAGSRQSMAPTRGTGPRGRGIGGIGRGGRGGTGTGTGTGRAGSGVGRGGVRGRGVIR